MRKYRFMLAMLLAALCCTAYATATVFPVSEQDNGRTISVRAGDIIILKLQENPSTGYIWRFSIPPGLTVIRDRYIPPAPSKIGASGTRELKIRVMMSADQTLSAVYSRAWEPEGHGAGEFFLSLRTSDSRDSGTLPAGRTSRNEILSLLKQYSTDRQSFPPFDEVS